HEYGGAVAIHPFTSDPRKQWPAERFMELARRITQETKSKVVLVGKTENWGQSPAGTVPNLIDLVNQTSLVELAQVLKQCKLLISGDSGPMHLSAAVGTPVIALFRNDLAGKTARRWGPWGQGHAVIENNDLAAITVEQVLAEARGRLK
ncbi:MAG: glycosyltransferase family 9 protein, partial [Candidatus Omnitrophota bacterium]